MNSEVFIRIARLGHTLCAAGNSMTSSERSSPEPLLKKRGVPSGTEAERSLEMLWRLQIALNYRAWGFPAGDIALNWGTQKGCDNDTFRAVYLTSFWVL